MIEVYYEQIGAFNKKRTRIIPDDEYEKMLNSAKKIKADEIRSLFETKRNALVPPYVGKTEQKTWDIQEKEARLYLQNKKTTTPFIDALLEARDREETKLELINKIITASDNYLTDMARLLGQQQNVIKQIDNCKTVDEVNAIVLI